MTIKESTLTLTPAHWIGLLGIFGGLIIWAIYVEVQLAEIRSLTLMNKESISTYVQQNYNDHRGMYVDFKGEIQILNKKLDDQTEKIDKLKDLIIQSSRGVRLPQK